MDPFSPNIVCSVNIIVYPAGPVRALVLVLCVIIVSLTESVEIDMILILLIFTHLKVYRGEGPLTYKHLEDRGHVSFICVSPKSSDCLANIWCLTN